VHKVTRHQQAGAVEAMPRAIKDRQSIFDRLIGSKFY
jgi:hypothetical protein